MQCIIVDCCSPVSGYSFINPTFILWQYNLTERITFPTWSEITQVSALHAGYFSLFILLCSIYFLKCTCSLFFNTSCLCACTCMSLVPMFVFYRYYNLYARDIMRKDILYVSYQSTYREIKQLLKSSNHASFPLVDNPGGCSL